MDYNTFAKRIIELKNLDLALREKLIQSGQLEQGYNMAMETLHNSNAKALDQIIEKIGYPTILKVGEKASKAAWLVIQHAISQPPFMKKCFELLKKAVSRENASPLDLAYLTDRIAVFEGGAQLYGTQFDWDESGVLNPQPFDDLAQVNQRRKALGLNTLEEQTELLRNRARQENQKPPRDFAKRRKEFEQWRKRVGWVK